MGRLCVYQRVTQLPKPRDMPLHKTELLLLTTASLMALV